VEVILGVIYKKKEVILESFGCYIRGFGSYIRGKR